MALNVRPTNNAMYPLLARPRQPSGYTWTIASRISDALNEAEQRFGPRDQSYFYAGHEFVSRHPSTWYPGDRQHIVIQLGLECSQDMVQATYQLAHEVIHLLSPTGAASANVLEEGLATWFSEDYCRRATGQTIRPTVPSYGIASDLVRSMLESSSDCIRLMRQVEPCISKIPSTLISQFCPSLTEAQADTLAARFVRE